MPILLDHVLFCIKSSNYYQPIYVRFTVQVIELYDLGYGLV